MSFNLLLMVIVAAADISSARLSARSSRAAAGMDADYAGYYSSSMPRWSWR